MAKKMRDFFEKNRVKFLKEVGFRLGVEDVLYYCNYKYIYWCYNNALPLYYQGCATRVVLHGYATGIRYWVF